MLFFGYFSDSLTILPETHPVISRMDFNFDSRIDTLDIEKFLFFLFYNNHPQAQSHPRALPADSLPRISPAAKKLALDWLAKLEPLHRDWPVWVDYYTLESKVAELRELVLTVRTTRPTVCDYNGDGHVNVLDLVVMLIGGINGDPLSDRDGDGVFRINDLVLFLNYMRSGRCP